MESAGTGAALHELARCINSRGGGRVDLTSTFGSLGNNFRVVLPQHALALGLRKVLYLDCDTVVQAPIGPLYGADDRAPLVVANLSESSRDWGFAYSTFGRRDRRDQEQMWEQRRAFGFVDVRAQAFNAGVSTHARARTAD